jgi:hypothetical protein
MKISTPGPIVVLSLVLSLALATAISCGEITTGPASRLVGGACTADGDCEQRCLADDSRFPGGLCTVACSKTADCPAGSACLSHNGGVCAVACRASADCAAFGRGYTCENDEQAAGGEVLVCRAP